MYSFARGQPQGTMPAGRVRTYYIAADEVDWDYAPSGKDLIHGEKYHLQDDPASKGTLDPNATVYRKALFREYTDADFKTLKPSSEGGRISASSGPSSARRLGTPSRSFSRTIHRAMLAFIRMVCFTESLRKVPTIKTTRAATTRPTTAGWNPHLHMVGSGTSWPHRT